MKMLANTYDVENCCDVFIAFRGEAVNLFSVRSRTYLTKIYFKFDFEALATFQFSQVFFFSQTWDIFTDSISRYSNNRKGSIWQVSRLPWMVLQYFEAEKVEGTFSKCSLKDVCSNHQLYFRVLKAWSESLWHFLNFSTLSFPQWLSGYLTGARRTEVFRQIKAEKHGATHMLSSLEDFVDELHDSVCWPTDLILGLNRTRFHQQCRHREIYLTLTDFRENIFAKFHKFALANRLFCVNTFFISCGIRELDRCLDSSPADDRSRNLCYLSH